MSVSATRASRDFYEGWQRLDGTRGASPRLLVRLVFLSFLRRAGWIDGGSLSGLLAGEGAQPLFATPLTEDVPELDSWLEYLGRWDWTLDPQASPTRRTLTPDTLGYVFERSLDRKSSGSYYTAADVTDYICANTVIPRLFDGLSPGHDLSRAFTPATVDRCLHPALLREELLPHETEPERQGRIQRRERLHANLLDGRVRTINDCVTRNLHLPAVAVAFIEMLPEPDVLERLYWNSLRRLRVLDPTCGAGAFLLAVLRVLQPLYEACLQRMEAFLQRPPAGCPTALLARFEAELARAGSGPQREASIRRTILTDHLFGVDLSEEAVEACRLRLWLELLAAVRGDSPAGLELPDLRANLQAGDALLGSARPGVGGDDETSPGAFHWPLRFPGVMAGGGFDAVVGNPPYVERSRETPRRELPGFATARCGNLFAPVVERSLQLLAPGGRLGVIVPISVIAGAEYRPLMELLRRHDLWISSYSNRPAKLFEGVEQRLAVLLTGPSPTPVVRVTAYQHWYEAERPHLFARLEYSEGSCWPHTGMPIKSGSEIPERLFGRISALGGRLAEWAGNGDHAVWLHDSPTYWVRALPFEPEGSGDGRAPSHYHRIGVPSRDGALALAAVLSSSVFYFFFKMVSNCRDLGRKEWREFPMPPRTEELVRELGRHGEALERRLRETASRRTRVYPRGTVSYDEYYPARAADVIERIDAVLARSYGLEPEELEFLQGYERKYRIARDVG